ncbi:MAG: biotin/lipoyl-binding protein, partial [Clostridiaceae bacterium]|nr:biotin/lipoyl-binding protein [Clostridiaceae bacterium]
MKKLLLMVIIIFCFAGLTACIAEESGDDIKPASAGASGTEATNGTKAKNNIDAFGVVKSDSSENIYIDFPSIVKEVHVKEGENVKKDDKLFTLDMQEYEDQKLAKERELIIAELELESARHEITKEKNAITSEEQELKLIKEDLAKKTDEYDKNSSPEIKKLLNDRKHAKNTYDISLNDLKSKEQLLNSGYISIQEFEDFKRSVEEKEKALSDIEFSIESTKSALKKEIDSLKASRDQKELNVKLSREQVSSNGNVKIQQEKVAGIKQELEMLKSKVNQPNLKDSSIIAGVDKGIVYEILPAQGDKLSERTKIASIVDRQQLYVA